MTFHPYALALLVSAIVSVIVSLIAWRRRTAAGAVPLVLLMLTLLEWSLTYAVHWLTPDLRGKWFWLDATYIGVVTAPTLFLVFSLQYTNRKHWLTARNLGVLALLAGVWLVLEWTDPWHGLYFGGKRAADATNFLDGGVGFWITIIYLYGLTLFGFALLAQAYIRAPRLYRRQTGTILLGALLPWLGATLGLLGMNPTGLDLTPIMFMLTGLVFTYALFWHRLLDIVPIARHVLVENMQDGMLVLDDQHRILDINPAAQTLLGLTAAEAIGQRAERVFAHWPELVQRYSDVPETREELTLGDPPRSYDVQITPLSDSDGQLTGRLIVWHDISELKAAGQVLRAYADELEARNDELDAFAHTVAHDLKGPLGALIGYAGLVEQMYDKMTKDMLLRYMQNISRGGMKMNTIVDELLLLAEARKGDVRMKPLEMNIVVAEARVRLLDLIAERQAEINVPDSWPDALGHAPWVEEIWANYLSNAIKYGGEPPRITLGADPCDGGDDPPMVRFWVQDNGKGLPPGAQEQLFAPFKRLVEDHEIGHGLGLSIVRRIVEKLGGSVGVESEIGAGSMFWFTLPAAEGEFGAEADSIIERMSLGR